MAEPRVRRPTGKAAAPRALAHPAHLMAEDNAVTRHLAQPVEPRVVDRLVADGVTGRVMSRAEARLEITRWMDRQAVRIRTDRDLLLPISGERRTGKSTLAMWWAMYWDPDFDLNTQMAWTAKQFTVKARAAPKYKPIILDEGIRGLMSMDALTDDNKHLAKFATIAGDRNLIGMLILPNLRRLASIFREDYCEWNPHIESRGRAVLRRLKDDEDRMYDRPMDLIPFDFDQLPVKIESEYRKLKFEFQERFDDGKAWDTETVLRADIRRRLAPLVQRRLTS